MNTCDICGETVIVPDDLEHTGLCNLCAQERVEKLETALKSSVFALEKLRNLVRRDGHSGQHAADSCEYCGRQYLGELAIKEAEATLKRPCHKEE